jgi:hypothetical protein
MRFGGVPEIVPWNWQRVVRKATVCPLITPSERLPVAGADGTVPPGDRQVPW